MRVENCVLNSEEMFIYMKMSFYKFTVYKF